MFKGHFSTLRPFGLLYSYPQQVPAFISRGAPHHTDARDLYQRRRELVPRNFASRSVIYKNPLSSFTCRKAGTWDILFYFPSEGRHTEDFSDTRKSSAFNVTCLCTDACLKGPYYTIGNAFKLRDLVYIY